MFSRRWTWLVLACWLLVTGWFVVRDLWPRWRNDEPAAFAVGIGDEPRLSITGTVRPRSVDMQWYISRNGVSLLGRPVTTRIQYDKWRDALEFCSEFRLHSIPGRRPWLEAESTFRVDWEGRLQSFEAELRLIREPLLLVNPGLVGQLTGAWLPGLLVDLPAWQKRREQEAPASQEAPAPSDIARIVLANGGGRSSAFRGRWPAMPRRELPGGLVNLLMSSESTTRCRGDVRDGHFLARWSVTGEQREPVWNPLPLSPRGHVLVPFHPLNRLSGLRPGQRWRVPLVDLEASLNMERHRETRLVVAEVGPATTFRWQNHPQVCFQVTYRDGDREVCRVWARQSDGLVLQQKLTFSSVDYTLVRARER